MAKRSKPKTQPISVPADASRDWLLGVLAIAGVALTSVLFAVSVLHTALPYCGDGSGCDLVQSSRWSMFLGAPITLWGLLVYVLIAVCALLRLKEKSRWQFVTALATIAFAISCYLNTVAYFVIEATCIYCLSSLVLIGVIFALSWRAPAASGVRRTRVGASIAALLIVGAMHLHYAGVFDPAAGPEDPYLRALAEHLSANDAKFYGAYWCPHCQQQKLAFGASAKRLPYVECSPNGPRGSRSTECLSADIRNYPTWIVGGRRMERTLTPKQLAKYAGFKPDHDWPAP